LSVWFILDKKRISTNKKVNFGYYTFQSGDRIRFIGRWMDDGGFNFRGEPIDVEIIDVGYDTGDGSYKKDESDAEEFILDSDGNKVTKETAQYLIVKDFDFESINYESSPVLIEVYTPENIDDDNNVFYEIGEMYPIDHPGTTTREHSNTSITFDGDVYTKLRMKNAGQLFMCEDANFSDIYESAVWDRGRANIYIEDAETRWYSEYLKHSKSWLKDSINGLSDFDAVQINLNGKYGEITALTESGFTLQVKQELKDYVRIF